MSTIQNSNLIAAAVGAAIGVISVATVFIFNKVMERQQRTVLNRNIDRVNRKVAELQTELEELRAQQANLQKSKKRILVKRLACSNENTYTGTEDVDIDTFSTAGTDVADEEFFDCSDDEGEDKENRPIESTISEDSEFSDLDKESEEKTLQINHYQKLRVLLQDDPNNIEIVWRFARACYYCSNQTDDLEKKKDFIFEGCDACENVLNVRHIDLYKWYAILIGLKGNYLPIKSKIEFGYRFKEYVEKALEINPNDGFLHHLLGRFKYEISELSWIQKKVASTLFSELPIATYEDAISDFEKAEKLLTKPHYENKLFISKSYVALGKYKKAVTWLNQINESCVNTNENHIRNEAKQMLEKYFEYCT